MANPVEILREVMTLTSNVADLKSNLTRVDSIVLDHEKRITKLEAREDYIIAECQRAALVSVNQISNGLTEKLTELKMNFKSLNP